MGIGLEMFFFLRTVLLRRFGVVGLFLTVYDVWRRIPVRQRKWLLDRVVDPAPGLRRASGAEKGPIDAYDQP